jgi:hypothetical protein
VALAPVHDTDPDGYVFDAADGFVGTTVVEDAGLKAVPPELAREVVSFVKKSGVFPVQGVKRVNEEVAFFGSTM